MTGTSWFTNPPDTDRGPLVELWVHDSYDGQSVIAVGERSDGQRFFGSFWQPHFPSDDEKEVGS